MEEAPQFGKRLRELRIQAGLTQRELAEKIGVDFSYLSKIENGVLPPPSEKAILRLAEALNADRDELITLAGRIPADIAQMLKYRKTLELLRSERTKKKVMSEVTKPRIPIFNYKNFTRVTVAIALVIVCGAVLWFAPTTEFSYHTAYGQTGYGYAAPVVAEGGEPKPRPAVGDVSGITDEEGEFTKSATFKSLDGNVNLFIPKGTTGLTQDGEPLSKITITKVSPPDPPADTNFIGLTYDLEPDGATFDPEISLTFTYNPAWIPPRATPENLTIAYWDEDARRWVELDAEDITIDPERNIISCDISHFTYFSVIVYTRPADITASALTISPSTVDIAKSVQISVTLTNTGDLAGSHEVTLKINNVAVSTKKVTLDGHATEKVTFTSVQGAPGSYTVTVNGITGAFTVKPAPIGPVVITQPLWTAPPAPPPAAAPPAPVPPPVPAPVAPLPVNWLIVGIFAAVAVIVVSIIVWVFGFRSQY